MFRIMTILLASLVFIASSETDLEARCGGGSGRSGRVGFFGRFRTRTVSRGYQLYAVPANNAVANCSCVQATGSCPCSGATAQAAPTSVPAGCRIVNGQLVCPTQP